MLWIGARGARRRDTGPGHDRAAAHPGVPLKRMVAGVAMGLILESDGRFVVLAVGTPAPALPDETVPLPIPGWPERPP